MAEMDDLNEFVNPASLKGIDVFDYRSSRHLPLPAYSSLKAIRERFGNGIVMYFYFHIFILIINILLTFTYIGSYALYVTHSTGTFFDNEFNFLYMSNIQPGNEKYWIIFNCSCVALVFVSLFVFYFVTISIKRSIKAKANKANIELEKLAEQEHKLLKEVKIERESWRLTRLIEKSNSDDSESDFSEETEISLDDPNYTGQIKTLASAQLDEIQRERVVARRRAQASFKRKEFRNRVKNIDEFTEDNNNIWELEFMGDDRPEEIGFIEANLRVSSLGTKSRRIVSAVLTTIVCIILCGAMGWCTYLFSSDNDVIEFIPQTVTISEFSQTPINIYDYIISFILFVLSSIGRYISIGLTHFERQKIRMKHSTSKTIKLVLIKLLLIVSMYVSQRFFVDYSKQPVCPLSDYGNKFLSLILMDFVLVNVTDFGVPMIRMIKYRFDFSKPKTIQFDIAAEVMLLCYRQFIIFLAMPIIPIVAPIGAVFNIIEYFLKMVRLCKLSYNTKRTVGFTSKTLPLLLFFTLLTASFTYPNGLLFVLSGEFRNNDVVCKCYVLSDHCTK